MQIYVAGDLDEEFFQERAVEVLYKIEGEEGIDFNLIVVGGREDCDEIFDEIPIEKKEKFTEQCHDVKNSTSFKAGDQEFIVIKADKEFLKENEKACRGLIAHELTHTIQRHQGLEKLIEEAAFSKIEKFIDDFKEEGFSDDVAREILISVMKTAIFCLKDIHANTDAVRQSFYSDLQEYYYHELGMDDFCPKPDFYGEEAELQEVVKVIKFELQLLPSWLPFEAMERDERGRVRKKIEDFYEANVKEVAYYIHRLRDVYHDEYGEEGFLDDFFEEVFQAFKDAIDAKLD